MPHGARIDADHAGHAQAQAALRRLEAELRLLNASAAKSLSQGLEETLTLHRLGLFRELGLSFKTTTCVRRTILNTDSAPS